MTRKCPIALDDTPELCSAQVCDKCIAERRREMIRKCPVGLVQDKRALCPTWRMDCYRDGREVECNTVECWKPYLSVAEMKQALDEALSHD